MASEKPTSPVTAAQARDLVSAFECALAPLEAFLDLLRGAQSYSQVRCAGAGDAGEIGSILLRHCKAEFEATVERLAGNAPGPRFPLEKDAEGGAS